MSDGEITTDAFCEVPFTITISDALTVIDVTGTLFSTFTTHVALILLPSVVFTLILAVPSATPVTFPLLLTTAILEFELLHFTLLFDALEGLTFAFNSLEFPSYNLI